MGIGGHILGPKKLRRLEATLGRSLRRAYIRNDEGEAVEVLPGGGHQHLLFDRRNPASTVVVASNPTHWTSCRELSEQ